MIDYVHKAGSRRSYILSVIKVCTYLLFMFCSKMLSTFLNALVMLSKTTSLHTLSQLENMNTFHQPTSYEQHAFR